MVPCDNVESAGDPSSTSRRQSAPSSAAASVAQLPPPSRHLGAACWSWIPGVCGACGCTASGWSLLPRGPPWLPSDPHARVHLRLLWSFYSSSLPNSCIAMRGALRVGALSALRAEATLLSLLARGLGFSALALSARRLAEICDIHDTGGPNPAWGPHHPLATAGGFWRSLADLAMARRRENAREVGSVTQQGCSKMSVSSSNSSSSDSSASSSSSSSSRAGSGASERRRPLARRPLAPVARASHGNRAAVAKSEISTEPPHLTVPSRSAGNGHGMHGNTRCASDGLQQHRMQERQQPDLHQQLPEHQHQNHCPDSWLPAFEQLQHSNRRSLPTQEQMQQQQMQQQQKQQEDAWDRVAALRREISSSAIRLPGHPVHDALVACLSELHAAKQVLAFLFEDKVKDKKLDTQGAHTLQHSAVPIQRPAHSMFQSRKRTIWSSSVAAASAAANAVAATAARAAAALGRLASFVCGTVAPRVRQPLSSVGSWLSGALSGLLHSLGEGTVCAAAAALAAAQAAACRGYSVRLIQNALLVADSIWGPAAWLGICRGESLCFGLSFLWGPFSLQQLLQEAARQATKRWDFACSLVSRSLLPAVAALNQLQQLHQLLSDWRLFGLNRWGDVFASFSRRADSSSSARSSPWATPEGLRRGASTSTCYWSPPEKPAVYSQEKLLTAPPSAAVLPQHQQLLQPPPPHELQQQLLEEQSGQELRDLQRRLQQVRREWQQHSELEKDCDSSWMSSSSHRSRSSAAASNAAAAAPPGNQREVSTLRLHKGSRRSWTCPPNADSGLDDPLDVSLDEVTSDALSRDAFQGNPLSGESIGSMGPSSSHRRLSNAAAATRAAAAGAAAAAATASWGAGDAAWPQGRRRPLRHVSFLREDESFPSESASGLADWNVTTVAAPIKTDSTGFHAPGDARFYLAGIHPRERSGGPPADLPAGPDREVAIGRNEDTKSGSSVRLSLGSWQAPRFYVYQAGEVPGTRRELLYVKESTWGPAAAQVGPAPVFLSKYLELQASPANATPLKGRKTIELGAGCGLVSMVAALMGAEASACEDDAALPLLQHNVATFNSEFSKCKPVRTCSFPISEKLRGQFDLVLVTDHVHSLSARIQTLETLLALLDKDTVIEQQQLDSEGQMLTGECVIAHTWRNQEPEEAFFKALGKSLVVRRVEEQRSIQRKCSQPLNRSIADSARDIWEATDEDGSIEIFSVRPHADIATQTWREELGKLLKQLREEDAARAASPPVLTREALTETKELLSKQKEESEVQTVALSSCSTLSSIQGGPLSSIIASGSHTPADQGPPPALSSEESFVSNRVPASALIQAGGLKAPAQSFLLRNSSQPVLQQQPLRAKKREMPSAPPKGVAAPPGAAPGSPVSPAASRVRPQTSTSSAPTPQSQQQQARQQRLAPSSLTAVRATVGGASASTQARPLRSVPGARAPGSPSLGSPLNASKGAAQAAVPARVTGPASAAPNMNTVRAVLRTAPSGATASAKATPAQPLAKAAVGNLAKFTGVTSKAPAPPGMRLGQQRHSVGAVVPRSPPVADNRSPPSAAPGLKKSLPALSPPMPSLAQPRQLLTSEGLAAPAKSTAAPASRPSAAARPRSISNQGAGVGASLGPASAVAAAKAPGLSMSEKPTSHTVPLVRPLTSGGGPPLSKSIPLASRRPPSAGSPVANTGAAGDKALKTLERQTSTHITAAGPLGSRFVSRLSSLFKRSQSKELKD
ncbi:hypothetical protein Emed_001388 [Eimeria media]